MGDILQHAQAIYFYYINYVSGRVFHRNQVRDLL